MSNTLEETNAFPCYDILGLDAGATITQIEAAFDRLEVYYDRNNMLEFAEFQDITKAYETLQKGPASNLDFDRGMWQWETLVDKNGQWNTAVFKAHRLARKAKSKEMPSSKDKDDIRRQKKENERGRAKERGRRSDWGNDE